MFTFFVVWFLVAFVVGPAVGCFMAQGMGETDSEHD